MQSHSVVRRAVAARDGMRRVTPGFVAAAVMAAAAVTTACSGGGSGGSPASASGTGGAARRDTGAVVLRAAASAARSEGKCSPGGRLRVLMVGTSLTAGYGLDPEQAYPSLLQKKADSAGFDVEIVNAGVSGETSAGALQRADWLLRAPVDVFYLETGANDGLRAFDPDVTRRNVRDVLAKARAAHPNAELLLAQMEAPTNLGSRYTSRFHELFPDAARQAGATLVPFLLDRVAGVSSLNQGDGIHPNVAGERIVAENVWPSVERAVVAAARARRGALDPCPA